MIYPPTAALIQRLVNIVEPTYYNRGRGAGIYSARNIYNPKLVGGNDSRRRCHGGGGKTQQRQLAHFDANFDKIKMGVII